MSDSEPDNDLFQEPQDYYQPEKQPSHFTYTFLDGRQIELRLVGQSPLWGHYLWNAGKVISEYLQRNAEDIIRRRTVLELGAGAGLPSITAALHGASHTVVTDYPDADLIENLEINVKTCKGLVDLAKIDAKGLLWGADCSEVTALVHDDHETGFDVLILADLLFNHSEHGKLVDTICSTLIHQPGSQALVFFTPYRPWLYDRDMAFFDLARQRGFKVEKLMETVMDKVMFEEDPGDELLRRTVFGYKLTWTKP